MPNKLTKETTRHAAIEPTRMISLDIIRGVALLGILIMNIQSFSMPGAAYLNPTAYGDLNGTNWYAWLFSHLFADMKFMSIFSILFGAGILVFTQRAEEKLGSSLKLHYRRNTWLLIFGLIHAHLIWYGDILYAYAICAFLIYWLRNRSGKTLFILAIFFLSIGFAINLLTGLSIPHIPEQDIKEIMQAWQPDNETINRELNAYRGDIFSQFEIRHKEAYFMETQVFLSMFIWRVLGMMCLGMALLKWQILSAAKSTAFYLKLFLICLPLGLAISAYGAYQNIEHAFKMEYSFFIGSQYNFWGSVLVSLSYISIICLWVQSNNFQSLKLKLAAVGKTAFSNYILHSLVFTFIFYGHGLGLFGSVERWQTLLMVCVMWALQLLLSPLWLKYFYYGPLEWLWRSLTYWKVQSIRRPT